MEWLRHQQDVLPQWKTERGDIVRDLLRLAAVALLVSILVLLTGCGDDGKGVGPGDDTYDIDRYGIPKFVGSDYIELPRIQKISRFRSAEGHDYSDDFEDCRSMKHYFAPFGGDPGQQHNPSWGTISIHSPVAGTVVRVYEEWAGTQIQIKAKDHPAFHLIIFHVAPASPVKAGDAVAEGQVLGNHFGDQTWSDIAVGVNTPSGWKLVSYFDVMADSLFEDYQEAGVSSRDALIISKQERDADPLTCSGDTFVGTGNLENWAMIN